MKEELTELETVKARVLWIYSEYPDSIELNCVLNAIYQNYFGKVNSTSTIERCGRYWRNKLPNIYKRTKDKSIKDQNYQDKIKKVLK